MSPMNESVTKPKFIVSHVRGSGCGFKVRWQINPYMRIGATSAARAEKEHSEFTRALENCGAEILRVPYVPGAHDSVFMKDNALVIRKDGGFEAFLAKPRMPQRAAEPGARAFHLRSHGIKIRGQSEEHFEGGDVVLSVYNQRVGFMGHGFRTSKKAAAELSKFLGFGVIPLELKDPYFYHLDTALSLTHFRNECVAFAYPEAFTPASWRTLCAHPAIGRVVEVNRKEALRFALNWVECNGHVLLGAEAPATSSILKSLGKQVQVTPLGQFQLAGGSAACLVAQAHDCPAEWSAHAVGAH
jgi:N-dimethylarginine dimethylaminohydrolase